jgi:hypothetical protein
MRISPDTDPPRSVAALAGTRLYRPGGALAFLLLGAAPALAMAAALLVPSPGPGPLLALALLSVWLLLVPAAWSVLVSVRTSPLDIAAARPWRRWRAVPWSQIETAERRGVRIVLAASDGQRISFAWGLLQRGDQLYRDLLLRLPLRVLDPRLRRDAARLLGRVGPLAAGGVVDGARVRVRWRVLAATGGVVAGALGVAAQWAPALAPRVLGSAAAAALLVAAVRLSWWLGQRVHVSDQALTVVGPDGRHARAVAWEQLALVEHTAHETLVRLRGERRLLCVGPGLLAPEEGDQFRAVLRARARERGVLVVQRRWLW